MFRYAVNISMIGEPLPLADRIRAVADAGFPGVEFWFPHQFSMDELASLVTGHGLEVALFDLEPSASHPYGHVADPHAGAEFSVRLDDALRLAERLGCRTVNVLQGGRLPEIDLGVQMRVAIDRLGEAAPRAANAGVTLCLEAINSIDRPGSFCDRSAVGLAIVAAVGSPHVRFQYDIYHLQLMEGNLIRTLERNIDLIGHIQIADPPGRHEPGTGEVNVPRVLATLREIGYRRWVSLEYWPTDPLAHDFAWLPMAQRR